MRKINLVIKRCMDFIGAVIGLIIFSPVFLIIAISIKVSSKGTVFFLQERIGKNGRIFKILKFRTMVMGAEKTGDGLFVFGTNDGRITKIGKILRKTSLDEIPQLINVIKGDMSFVGPRPDVPGYADRLQGADREVLSLKPGITGPASLKYRNEEELLALQDNPQRYNDEVIFPDKVRINREYMRHWSFGLDMKIIIYTLLGKDLEQYYEL